MCKDVSHSGFSTDNKSINESEMRYLAKIAYFDWE